MNMNKGQRITIMIFLYVIAGLFLLSGAGGDDLSDRESFIRICLGLLALAAGIFIHFSGKKK